MHALRKVPDTKNLEPGFAATLQGVQEPYITFMNQLQSVVRRQIEMQAAVDVVLKSLAYGFALCWKLQQNYFLYFNC